MNDAPDLLNVEVLARTGANAVEWLSPLKADQYAEYRDTGFLERLGAADLASELAAWWPKRGPQWDALGRTDCADLLLVEAKAHIGEMFSPATQASPASLATIERALAGAVEGLSAAPKAPWSQCFFQYANRIAHLDFLRRQGRSAWLVLVSFVGDEEMGGPSTAEAWQAAYDVMDHVMGLRSGHPLACFIIHVHPHVRDLASPQAR